MLLRRITEHLRNQNWFAVAIDFVIVVAGVFLGIQVANWNDALAQERLGHQYQQRMIADLKSDLEIYQSSSSYYLEVLDNVRKADRLIGAEDPDPRELVIAAYRASEFMNNPHNRTTWERVVGSGHIDLLPQQALDDGLADYYRFNPNDDESLAFMQGSSYRKLARSIIPLEIQLDIRENCSDVVDENNYVSGFVDTCELQSDAETLAEAAEALRTHPSIRAELRYQYSTVAMVDNNATGSIPVIRRLIALLEDEGDRGAADLD